MSTPLLPAVLLGAQRPRVHSGPTFSTSAGVEAVELAAELGLNLDPWQAWVLEQSLGERPDGKWSAFQVCLLCPRQNGKGSILEARELAGIFLFGEKKITHSAHEAKTSKDHFERLESLLRNAGYGDDQVVYRRSTTEVSILLKATGCKIHFYTRTDNGGRGLGGDVVVLDEAYALTRDQMAALMPTMSARSVTGNPQMWFTSSAGFAGSDVLANKKRQGEEASDPRLAYFDWSAEPTADLLDPHAWAQANPGLNVRVAADFVAAEYEDLGKERFARERLGMWAEADPSRGLNFSTWSSLADPSAERGASPVFGVATAPDRSWSAIAVAWRRPDGLPQVMLADYAPTTAWVEQRWRELNARWGGKIFGDLASKGLVEGAEYPARAVVDNGLDDLITAGAVRHGNEPALNTAVRAATWKPSGDTRVLERRGASDISPVVAAALAVHGVMMDPPDSRMFVLG